MDATLWLCVLIPLTLIVFLYQHITRHFNYWKDQGVPYLPPVPLFGNLFKVVTLQQSLGLFVKTVYNYADSRFIGFFMFDQPFLLVRDPDIIKDILIKDFDHFENRSMLENRQNDKIGSNMLSIIKNPEWRQLRTKVTPAFTSSKVKGMLPLMREASEDLILFIKQAVLISNGVVEVKGMCMKYTVDTISSCAFGVNSQSFKNEDGEFLIAARRIVTFTLERAISVGCQFFAHWIAKLFRLKLIEHRASDFIRSVFWEQMHQRKASKLKRGDLIDILLQLKEENNDSLDGDVLAAQAMQFFVAGFETTASTILFTLYELALNKDVQNKLRKEIKNTLEERGQKSYDIIMDMKYLDCVISEALRRYPPVTFLERRCTKTYAVPNSGLTIQEGIPVYMSLLGLHMDPTYFPEPEKFDPDCFADKRKNSFVPYSYLPFGDGPRNCIGIRFSLVNAKSAIMDIISKFEVDVDRRTPVPLILDAKTSFLNTPVPAF